MVWLLRAGVERRHWAELVWTGACVCGVICDRRCLVSVDSLVLVRAA